MFRICSQARVEEEGGARGGPKFGGVPFTEGHQSTMATTKGASQLLHVHVGEVGRPRCCLGEDVNAFLEAGETVNTGDSTRR